MALERAVVSTVAWLSYDSAERDRTLKLIELFKESGTVDELGVGSIRDTFAEALFPGTSVIQTRARYLLFIPWLLELTVRDARHDTNATDRLRRNEITLIHALLAAGETDGVIGQSARDKLKRMPSAVYWAALRRYGIRTSEASIEAFLREAHGSQMRRRNEPVADDDGLAVRHTVLGLDPELAVSCPPPDGLLTAATLALTDGEASYLRDRIVGSTPGSLLAWLLARHRRADVENIWWHPDRAQFPDHLRDVVGHGERFHHAIHGALLLYNLILAEKKQSAPLAERYRAALENWHREVADHGTWDGWSREEFWATLRVHNRNLPPRTVAFVNRWWELAPSSRSVAEDPALHALVREREYQLKRSRARLVNQSALDNWQGESGLVRLDYRWGITRRITDDIFDGLGVHA